MTFLLIAASLLFALAGCGAGDPTIALRRELIDANSQVGRLTADNLALQDQLRHRDEQIATLQALGAGKRLEKLYTVKKIEVGDRSGGVSLDDKPGDSGVKVYVEPLDQYGSAIKAAGEATVELYDLAAPPGENLVATCHYPIEDVGKKWINGFLTQQYVFECPWGKDQPKHNQITIRVAFVEYLSGQTFTDQKVVSVTLRPTTQPTSAPQPAPMISPAAAPQPAAATAPVPAPAPGPTSAPSPSPLPQTAPAPAPASSPSGWSP